MTFRTLQNTDIATITATFNEAFSDYVVPLKLTESQLTDKIKSDSIRLELSPGVYDGNQLTGIIMHGYDETEGKKIVYNGGTGVIPTYRGRQLTVELYDYILPLLKEQQIDEIVLEAITTNHIALKVYQSVGFHIVRTLNCYKGTIQPSTKNNFTIKPLPDYDWALMQTFWDSTPSWQNAITAMEQLRPGNISIGAFDNETLSGYLIFNPKMNRVQQFAVDKHYRNRGIAAKLFAFIAANHSKEISIINVDDTAVATNNFLKNIGLEKHLMQYEMKMKL